MASRFTLQLHITLSWLSIATALQGEWMNRRTGTNLVSTHGGYPAHEGKDEEKSTFVRPRTGAMEIDEAGGDTNGARSKMMRLWRRHARFMGIDEAGRTKLLAFHGNHAANKGENNDEENLKLIRNHTRAVEIDGASEMWMKVESYVDGEASEGQMRVVEPAPITAIEDVEDAAVELGSTSICGAGEEVVSTDCLGSSVVKDQARATARMMSSGCCTAWLVKGATQSRGALMLSTGHCGDDASARFEFFYVRTCPNGAESRPRTCNGNRISVESRKDEQAIYELDKNCAVVNEITPILLDIGRPEVGEGMYLIGHPMCRPQVLSHREPHDDGHHCEVKRIFTRLGSTRASYYCDTRGGNSGSPVFSARTGYAFAIHAQGGCWRNGGSNSGGLLGNSGVVSAFQQFGIPFVKRNNDNTDLFKYEVFQQQAQCPDFAASVDLKQKSLAECKKLCVGSLTCIGIEYSPSAQACSVNYRSKATTSSCKGNAQYFLRPSALTSSLSSPAAPNVYIERSLVKNEGSNVGDFIGVSVVDCATRCDSVVNCLSLTYFKGNCHLKDKQVTANDAASTNQYSNRYKTYYIQTVGTTTTTTKATQSDGYTERSLVKYEGRSVGDFIGGSLADCKARCDAEVKCRSLTYFANNCHLKDKPVTANDAASTNQYSDRYKTYYIPTVGPDGYIERSLVKDEGNSVGDVIGVSLADCKRRCDAEVKCRSLTYFANNCHLKNKPVAANDAASTHQYSDRYKTYYRQGYIERSLVKDEGNSVGDFIGVSLADCKARCDAEVKCRSFAFSANKCHLKDKPVTANDAASTNQGSDRYKTYYK